MQSLILYQNMTSENQNVKVLALVSIVSSWTCNKRWDERALGHSPRAEICTWRDFGLNIPYSEKSMTQYILVAITLKAGIQNVGMDSNGVIG